MAKCDACGRERELPAARPYIASWREQPPLVAYKRVIWAYDFADAIAYCEHQAVRAPSFGGGGRAPDEVRAPITDEERHSVAEALKYRR